MGHRYAFSVPTILRQFGAAALLVEYLLSRGVKDELPAPRSDRFNEDDCQLLLCTILALPPAARTAIEQELRDVYELADEEGLAVLIEEAALLEGPTLVARLAECDGAHDAALWSLMNKDLIFERCVKIRSAERDGRYWHRRGGIPELVPDTSDEGLQRLGRALSDYFLREEGRGRLCHVDWLPRQKGHLFIAYPEDYASAQLEYDDQGRLERRKIRPAQDLLFSYIPAEHRLEVHAKGRKQRVQDLQLIFATSILGVTLTPYSEEEVAYHLDRLKLDDFHFVINPSVGLEAIEVRSIHMNDSLGGGKGVTLEVDGPPGRGVLRAASSYWAVTDDDVSGRYPLSMMKIDRARLQAFFRPVGPKKRGRTRTFTLNQYGSPLDQDGMDGIIRSVLLASGLERPSPELVMSERS